MLDPLATTSDLAARNIAVPSGFDVSALFNAASDAIRDAAGCPISQTTSTVVLIGDGDRYLDLPGGPVASVDSIVATGTDLDDAHLEGNSLYRCSGWRAHEVYTVTYTHGLAVVPADIVDIACNLVAMATVGDGYGAAGVLQSVHLGEYGESYAVQASDNSRIASPMTIPAVVRQRLRDRFGTSVVTVGWRR